MTRLYIILILTISLWTTTAFSMETTGLSNTPYHSENNNSSLRYSIGSTFCLIKNIISDKPVYFGQVNFGYRLTPKNNLLLEAITQTYYEPLGGSGNSEDKYPGKVFVTGIGLGYQRFLWKNSFASVIATPYMQKYYGDDDKLIQNGFQLYLHGTAGYRFEFLKNRWFIEPMAGVAFWPINTNMPDSFKEVDRKELDYSFEPRIKFGYRF